MVQKEVTGTDGVISTKILDEYDDIEKSIAAKQPYNKKYEQECNIFSKQIMETVEKSCQLSFRYDKERDEAEREQRRKEQEQYEEKHRYDDFEAVVHYDSSYKRDFSNQYWDSYFIKECIDPQHLSLDKSGYGKPIITIAKNMHVSVKSVEKKRTYFHLI